MTAAATAATPQMSAMAVRRCTSDHGASRAFEVLDLDAEPVRVVCKTLAQQMCIKAEVRQLVLAPRPADIDARAQPAAHTPFRLPGQHQTAMPVDRSDGLERGRNDLAVIQMQHRAAIR